MMLCCCDRLTRDSSPYHIMNLSTYAWVARLAVGTVRCGTVCARVAWLAVGYGTVWCGMGRKSARGRSPAVLKQRGNACGRSPALLKQRGNATIHAGPVGYGSCEPTARRIWPMIPAMASQMARRIARDVGNCEPKARRVAGQTRLAYTSVRVLFPVFSGQREGGRNCLHRMYLGPEDLGNCEPKARRVWPMSPATASRRPGALPATLATASRKPGESLCVWFRQLRAKRPASRLDVCQTAIALVKPLGRLSS